MRWGSVLNCRYPSGSRCLELAQEFGAALKRFTLSIQDRKTRPSLGIALCVQVQRCCTQSSDNLSRVILRRDTLQCLDDLVLLSLQLLKFQEQFPPFDHGQQMVMNDRLERYKIGTSVACWSHS